jgi:hypothetical protein
VLEEVPRKHVVSVRAHGMNQPTGLLLRLDLAS